MCYSFSNNLISTSSSMGNTKGHAWPVSMEAQDPHKGVSINGHWVDGMIGCHEDCIQHWGKQGSSQVLLPLNRGREGLMFSLGAGGIWIWISQSCLNHILPATIATGWILPALSLPTGNAWAPVTSLSGRQLLSFCDNSMKQLLHRSETVNAHPELRVLGRQGEILFWLEGHLKSFVL